MHSKGLSCFYTKCQGMPIFVRFFMPFLIIIDFTESGQIIANSWLDSDE
jgi:hypothetical protein